MNQTEGAGMGRPFKNTSQNGRPFENDVAVGFFE